MEEDTVHVWRLRLELEPGRIQTLGAILATEERERAGRFRLSKDRDRFIVSRALLRCLLGRYLKVDPASVCFISNRYGKPSLATAVSYALHFNLSHVDNLALVAVARGREVGVDVECLRASFAVGEFVGRVFSPQEAATLLTLPLPSQLQAFFTYWTLKEAFLKATGKGLAIPLDSFEVSLASNGRAAGVTIYGQPHEASRWSLISLTPGPGYVGALAVEGHDWRLHCWDWDE